MASFSFDDKSNTVSLKWRNAEIFLKFKALADIYQFIDALSTSILIEQSSVYHPVLIDKLQILDPLQSDQNFGNWPIRNVILEKDAIISIFNDKNLRDPERILDLGKLLGIFKISISSHQCPSARLSFLPIFMFRLVFSNNHYLICTKTQAQREKWMGSIVYWTGQYDFYLPGYLMTDSKQLVSIKVVKITPQYNTNIEIGKHYLIVILFDIIQVVDNSYDRNPVCLTISRSAVTNLKTVGDNILMLIFGEYKSITFRLDLEHDLELLQASFKKFMSRNIPSIIGIDSDEDLKALMNLSININMLSFSIDDKGIDSNCVYMIGFGNSGEMQAFKPKYSSVFGNYAYLLETKNEIYHWKGLNCKRRIHAKVLDLAVKIRRYRNLRPKITLVEPDDPKAMQKLFCIIGCSGPNIAIDGPNINQGDTRLFQIDSTAKYTSSKLILVKKGLKLSKNLLKPNLVYIVTIQNMVFLWTGSMSSQSDRALGSVFSRHLANLLQDKSPAICECMEHLEHPFFLGSF